MLPLLLLPLLVAADDLRPMTLRYLKPEGGKFVLESEVATRLVRIGTTYSSKTVRGRLTLTLTVLRNDGGAVQNAEIVTDSAGEKKRARLVRSDDGFQLTRDGKTEAIKAPADAIVTSAPDWSDIFELVRRYDGEKKGKQSFAGLWFHPVQPTLTPTFTIERTGNDTVKVKGKEEVLHRYEIKLRASTNRVWATADGKVVKIAPIVLEGYEEATRDLK